MSILRRDERVATPRLEVESFNAALEYLCTTGSIRFTSTQQVLIELARKSATDAGIIVFERKVEATRKVIITVQPDDNVIHISHATQVGRTFVMAAIFAATCVSQQNGNCVILLPNEYRVRRFINETMRMITLFTASDAYDYDLVSKDTSSITIQSLRHDTCNTIRAYTRMTARGINLRQVLCVEILK